MYQGAKSPTGSFRPAPLRPEQGIKARSLQYYNTVIIQLYRQWNEYSVLYKYRCTVLYNGTGTVLFTKVPVLFTVYPPPLICVAMEGVLLVFFPEESDVCFFRFRGEGMFQAWGGGGARAPAPPFLHPFRKKHKKPHRP